MERDWEHALLRQTIVEGALDGARLILFRTAMPYCRNCFDTTWPAIKKCRKWRTVSFMQLVFRKNVEDSQRQLGCAQLARSLLGRMYIFAITKTRPLALKTSRDHLLHLKHLFKDRSPKKQLIIYRRKWVQGNARWSCRSDTFLKPWAVWQYLLEVKNLGRIH